MQLLPEGSPKEGERKEPYVSVINRHYAQHRMFLICSPSYDKLTQLPVEEPCCKQGKKGVENHDPRNQCRRD